MLTLEEETKSVVARMVEMCQSCSDDGFCKECREDIQFFQDKFDFDVTEYITLSVPEDLQPDSETGIDIENIQTEDIEELSTAGFDLSHLENPPDEKIVKEEDAVLFQREKGKKVAVKSDIHLWLADLKKAIDFDSHEEAEGARKLVEQAAFNLGTHGRQILQEELEGEGGSSEQA